jgi:fucose permease
MSSFHAMFIAGGILCASAAAAVAAPLGMFFGGVALLGVTASSAAGFALRSWPGVPAVAQADRTVAASRRPLVLLALAATCLFMADATATNWSAEYVHGTLGGSDSAAAIAYGAYLGGVLVGRILGDGALTRFGVVRVLRTGGMLAVAGIALVVVTPVPAAGQLGFVLAGLGLAAMAPQIFTAAAALDPGGSAGVVSRVNVCSYLGFVLSPALIAVLTEVSSLRLAFAAQSLLVLVVVALAPALDPS